MKIAIVGSSHLDKDEIVRAKDLIFVLGNLHIKDDIITGDAVGVDMLVKECIDYAEVIYSHNERWKPDGYKERNITIAEKADFVYSIATKQLKDEWCYHCLSTDHNRTAGCWTKNYAINKFNKDGATVLV